MLRLPCWAPVAADTVKATTSEKGCRPISPQQTPGSILARGAAFWIDGLLLGILFMLLSMIFPLSWLDNALLSTTVFGVYRVIGEFFWGRSIGKSLLNLRVSYTDRHGRERSGADRLVFVILRNSWLLISGIVWLWAPEHELDGISFLLFLSLLFRKDRATLMDLLARARVVTTVA